MIRGKGSRNTLTLGLTSIGLALFLLLAATVPGGGTAQAVVQVNPEVVQGNPTCDDLQGVSFDGSQKIDSPGGDPPTLPTSGSGPHSYDEFTLDNVVYDGDGEIQEFDWSAEVDVAAVIVKGSNAANVYKYSPASRGDVDLRAPNPHAVSHITFCYNEPHVLSGHKFNDENANGDWDEGEAALSGVTIYLDLNENGERDNGEPYTQTDEDGYYEFENLSARGYIVREDVPDTWVCTSPNGCNYLVYMDINHSDKDFGNYQPTGDITIKKFNYNGDTPLDGALFKLERKEGDDWVVVEPDISTTDGIAVLTGMPPGEYRVTETSPPSGYTFSTQNPQTKDIVVDGNGEANDIEFLFFNMPVTGQMTINKYDEAGNLIVRDPSECAVFLVEWPENGNGMPVHTTYAVCDGTWTITDLPLGTYQVTETVAPSGYALADPSSQEGTIVEVEGYEGSHLVFDFYNTALEEPTGSITINKFNELEQPQDGATFKVERKQDGEWVLVQAGITTTGGTVTITDLPLGDYRVTETAPPPGYDLGDPSSDEGTIVEVNGDGSTLTFDFYNTPSDEPTGTLYIEKLVMGTDSWLGGATFRVTGPDGYDITVTDNQGLDADPTEGVIELSGLQAGVTYTVEETDAPDGFTAVTDPVDVLVDDGPYYTGYAYFENAPDITVEKTDQYDDPVEGARICLGVMNSDHGDGKVGLPTIRLAESEVGLPAPTCLLTDENGRATFQGFGYGEYLVWEDEVPEGYVPGEKAEGVEVTVHGDGSVTWEWDGDNPLPIVFVNPKLDIPVFKHDQYDDPIEGVEFCLYVDPMGDDLGDPLECLMTGPAGMVVFSDLDPGYYIVTETTSTIPSGYSIGDYTEAAVQIDENGNVWWMPEIDAEQVANQPGPVDFENPKDIPPPPPPPDEPEYGKIRIIKENEDGEPLAGAEFELRTEAGNQWGTDTYTTDENGEVEINDLPDRTYVVVEITPPDGYGLADPSEQTVEVDENETAEVTFVNPEEEEEVEEEPEEPEEEPEPEEPVETEPEPPEAPALPETGGNYLAVVLLGLLLAIGGLIVRRSRG